MRDEANVIPPNLFVHARRPVKPGNGTFDMAVALSIGITSIGSLPSFSFSSSKTTTRDGVTFIFTTLVHFISVAFVHFHSLHPSHPYTLTPHSLRY